MVIYYRVNSLGVSIWCDEDSDCHGLYAVPDAGITDDWIMGLIAGAEIFGKTRVKEIEEKE